MLYSLLTGWRDTVLFTIAMERDSYTVCLCACVRACVCVRGCVRACVYVSVSVCVCVRARGCGWWVGGGSWVVVG